MSHLPKRLLLQQQQLYRRFQEASDEEANDDASIVKAEGAIAYIGMMDFVTFTPQGAPLSSETAI